MTGSGESRPLGIDGTEPPPGRTPTFLNYLPVAWLSVVLLLALRGLVNAFPFLFDHTLPTAVGNFILANVLCGLAVLVWGLYLLGLAVARSPHFQRRFAPWQMFVLAWTVAGAAYVLVVPNFGFSLRGLLFSGFEMVVGLACLRIVSRRPEPVDLRRHPDGDRPSTTLSVVVGTLGLVLGGAVGFGGGLLFGAGVAEVTSMSCFEGACGFFAFFMGLAGLLVGALAGAILGVWLSRRQHGPSQAS